MVQSLPERWNEHVRFLDHEVTTALRLLVFGTTGEYCERMGRPGEWGDLVMVALASVLLARPIALIGEELVLVTPLSRGASFSSVLSLGYDGRHYVETKEAYSENNKEWADNINNGKMVKKRKVGRNKYARDHMGNSEPFGPTTSSSSSSSSVPSSSSSSSAASCSSSSPNIQRAIEITLSIGSKSSSLQRRLSRLRGGLAKSSQIQVIPRSENSSTLQLGSHRTLALQIASYLATGKGRPSRYAARSVSGSGSSSMKNNTSAAQSNADVCFYVPVPPPTILGSEPRFPEQWRLHIPASKLERAPPPQVGGLGLGGLDTVCSLLSTMGRYKIPLCFPSRNHARSGNFDLSESLPGLVEGQDFLVLIFVVRSEVQQYRLAWPHLILVELPTETTGPMYDIVRQSIKLFGEALGVPALFQIDDNFERMLRLHSSIPTPQAVSMTEFLDQCVEQMGAVDWAQTAIIGAGKFRGTQTADEISVRKKLLHPWIGTSSVHSLFMINISLTKSIVFRSREHGRGPIPQDTWRYMEDWYAQNENNLGPCEDIGFCLQAHSVSWKVKQHQLYFIRKNERHRVQSPQIPLQQHISAQQTSFANAPPPRTALPHPSKHRRPASTRLGHLASTPSSSTISLGPYTPPPPSPAASTHLSVHPYFQSPPTSTPSSSTISLAPYTSLPPYLAASSSSSSSPSSGENLDLRNPSSPEPTPTGPRLWLTFKKSNLSLLLEVLRLSSLATKNLRRSSLAGAVLQTATDREADALVALLAHLNLAQAKPYSPLNQHPL
jgi:hypothetical protein